jgi:serine/threonine protein kinase
MTSTTMSTPPPETIPGDRFILLEKIGEGGTAIVWRARDRELGTNVAIKILRSTDPEIQARFAQEVQVLANLHHANVVSALARGVTSRGAPYVALELVTGQSLRARLETGGPLPWREVVGIGVQLAEAVSALCSNGVVHRDLKPDNLMLTPDGDGGLVVKLIDFGVARLADDWDPGVDITPAPRPRTKLGVAVGTPGYMPPEAGYCPPDERFDVYGLAATLWEVGTGERVCGSPQATTPHDLPEDLREVLLAALITDPDDRTQSAAELGRGLEAVLAAHPEREPSALFDGRYERIAALGTGACGDAFFACHRGSRHEVVLKLLRARNQDDERRFVREADLLAHLDHPGIPRFYDHAPEASPPYIAMARAPGVPAVRLCPPEAPRMKFVEIAQVGIQLAETLKYLHARGILHRDLNANNVLIDLGREPRATLIDFGSAALTDVIARIPTLDGTAARVVGPGADAEGARQRRPPLPPDHASKFGGETVAVLADLGQQRPHPIILGRSARQVPDQAVPFVPDLRRAQRRTRGRRRLDSDQVRGRPFPDRRQDRRTRVPHARQPERPLPRAPGLQERRDPGHQTEHQRHQPGARHRREEFLPDEELEHLGAGCDQVRQPAPARGQQHGQEVSRPPHARLARRKFRRRMPAVRREQHAEFVRGHHRHGASGSS